MTWALNESTVVMPCNASGLLRPEALQDYSLISVDWSNAKNEWVQNHPMDSEMLLLQQAELNAAALPHSRTWIYRNIVRHCRTVARSSSSACHSMLPPPPFR